MREECLSPRYLSTAQAAKYLGYSTRTLEAFRANGGGPLFIAYAGLDRVTYDIVDLDAWAAGAKRLSTSEVIS